MFFGLHMVEGVAEYSDKMNEDGSPYRVLVGESVMREMDKSFVGRPVYVEHVDEVNVGDLGKADPADPTGKTKEAGYVIESFFNPVDGKHWCKFLIVSDEGRSAIARGWKLSNAYFILEKAPGGQWHGVDYNDEVTKAEYEHLAIVPDPRYQESLVLSPEDFKKYNDQKKAALEQLKNSKSEEKKPNKGDSSMKFSFFKKEKVENSADLEKMSVTLPKSGKEITISDLVTNADDIEMHKKEHPENEAPMEGEPVMAQGEHQVKLNSGEMLSINDLVKRYEECMKATNGEDEVDSVDLENDAKAEKEEEKPAEKNAEASDEEKEMAEKKKNALAEAKAKKQEAHDKLKNAHLDALPGQDDEPAYMMRKELVAIGQKRYGK